MYFLKRPYDMFTDGRIFESYSLNYQCHINQINQLQNISAYFTVLSKFCFILCMDTEKAILGRNKPRMSNFWNFPALVKSHPLKQFMRAKPAPPGHDFWSNAPGLPRGRWWRLELTETLQHHAIAHFSSFFFILLSLFELFCRAKTLKFKRSWHTRPLCKF